MISENRIVQYPNSKQLNIISITIDIKAIWKLITEGE